MRSVAVEAEWAGSPRTVPSGSAFFRGLAEHADGDHVAEAVARGLLAPFDPASVGIHVVRPNSGDFELAGQWGMPPDVVDHYLLVPAALPSPLRDVARTGTERFVSLRKVAADYSIARSYVSGQPVDAKTQMIFLPLQRRGVTVGVVSIRCPQPWSRTWALRETLDILTSGLTLWVLAYAASPIVAGRGRKLRSRLTLTDRQRDVLALVREGRTNAEIARRLGFSEVTIKADLTAMYKLFGASGRANLVEKADEAGL